jgi:hypothetical protein
MSVVVAQVLDGMPDPAHLHKIEIDDRVVIMVGERVLFDYPTGDTGMRNLAVVTLTQLRFGGAEVAALIGLTPQYVSMLRGRARDHGSAGLVRDRGRPVKLTAAQIARARTWRNEGSSDVAIGARLGVADTTVARALRDHPAPTAPASIGQPAQDEFDLDLQPATAAEPQTATTPEPAGAPEPGTDTPAEAEALPEALPEAEAMSHPEPEAGPGPCRGSAWIGEGVFFSRYAGAMLLHAFTDRVDATGVLTSAAAGAAGTGSGGSGGRVRFDDVALLAATSLAFGLGAATIEQVKHLTGAEAGPLCGLARTPDLRTLRPRLAAIADRCDPLHLQRAFATAMLADAPNTSGVYFVDDHFVPYTGAKPVPKGWDTKHRIAQRGRADTWVLDAAGRAVVFTTGEPSGLTTTLPGALAELRAVLGPTAKIMLGFDRGGAYAAVFTACRTAGADWITYRRAPLPPPRALPLLHTTIPAHSDGTPRVWVYADEPVTIDGYGTARQITLYEHGAVALQVLTSDTASCPIALLAMLKARWRIENAFKYAAEHHGIDALADYIAAVEVNTRKVDNPARKQANTTVKARQGELADAETALARLLTDRGTATTAAATAVLNRTLTAAHATIENARKALAAARTARDKIPAKLPANQIDPDAQRALLRTTRRGLQMVLRLLAYNGEHWLAGHLNAYLRDHDEYRAITRQTILRGLAGVITYTPDQITVALHAPDSPKTARALTLLLQEINNTPPRLPGDPRPITYTLTTKPSRS